MIYIRSNYAIWQLVFRSWLLGGTHGGRLTYEIGFISLRVMPLSVLPLRMITIRDGHISKRAKFLSLSTHHQMTSSTALSSTCFCHHNDTYHNFASIAPALACDVQYNLAVIRVLPTGQHIPAGEYLRGSRTHYPVHPQYLRRILAILTFWLTPTLLSDVQQSPSQI